MIIQDIPATLFVDLDGVLISHKGNGSEQLSRQPELLPGVIEKFCEWDKKGYKVVLTTGRKESHRQITEEMLRSLGLFWDHLIMGLGPGQRFIINDLKPSIDAPMAIAVNVERNAGLADISLEECAKKQQSIINKRNEKSFVVSAYSKIFKIFCLNLIFYMWR